MPKTASLNIRLDAEVKKNAESVYSHYGMSLAEAVTVFLHQSCNVGGMPFDLRPPRYNTETMEAIHAGDKIIKSGKARFNNAGAMLNKLKS